MQQSVSEIASTSSSVLAAGLSDPNLASNIAGANIAAQKDTIQAVLAKNCTDSKGVSSTDPATAEEKCQCPDGTLGDSFTTCRSIATYATACSDVQGTWDSQQNLCMFTTQEMNEKACSDLSATWIESTTSCEASIPGKQGSAPVGGGSSGYSKGNIAAITVGSLLAARGAYYMYQMAKVFRGVGSFEKFVQIANSIPLENGVVNPTRSGTFHSLNITLSYNSKTKYTLEYKLLNGSTEATFTHEGKFENSKFVTENIKMDGDLLDMREKAEYVHEIDAKFNTALEGERAIFKEAAPAARVKSKVGLGIGALLVIAGILTAVCGSGAVSCLADTNELPTKITTSNQRMQAMLQASDDFRASMGTLAQKLYPTAATP